MAIKISNNTVIDNSRNLTNIVNATITGTGTFSGTSNVQLPSGTTAQRPGAPTDGMIRYNSTLLTFEGYVNGAWGPIGGGGGATGGGVVPNQDDVFFENSTNVTNSYTITSGKNAMTAGPITINDGVEVTVPDGSVWTIV